MVAVVLEAHGLPSLRPDMVRPPVRHQVREEAMKAGNLRQRANGKWQYRKPYGSYPDGRRT